MYPWLPNSVILGLLYHGQQFKDLKECRNAMGSNCNAVESFQMALWTKDKWTIHTCILSQFSLRQDARGGSNRVWKIYGLILHFYSL